VLADLEARFALFRAEHPRGTRVPSDLRAATLAALRRGITPGALHRSCGVSWSQLEAWKSGRGSERTKVDARDEPQTDVRVFSVVDAEPVDRLAPGAGEVEELVLRLGHWSVRVRLAGRAQGA
jgi:hypothetical protein